MCPIRCGQNVREPHLQFIVAPLVFSILHQVLQSLKVVFFVDDSWVHLQCNQ
jgi:hypothetical protein